MRDNNTTSYPHYVDLGGGARETNESPYQTFNRELGEEFGLTVLPEEIIYSVNVRALECPDRRGWFCVAKLSEASEASIVFGDEGLHCLITSLGELIDHPLLIPRRREQLQGYLAHTASVRAIK